MVNSKDKGTRAEYQVRDMLRERTKLKWERVPGSGGLGATHGLKGDIYTPDDNCKYCVEVKHYKDEVLNSLMLKNPDNQLAQFWAQTIRESAQVNKEPLLIFKKDRGQWIVATRSPEAIVPEIMYTNDFREDKFKEAEFDQIYMYIFKDWLTTKERKDFIL